LIFNSYEFLFIFLPFVLVSYYLLPDRGRVVLLTGASYFFYGWWNPRFCLLMLGTSVFDFLVGQALVGTTRVPLRRAILTASIAANLSLLGFFKYAGLFATSANALLAPFTSWSVPVLALTLPVGISFYTFQSMSYTIDVYRGDAKPARSLLHFLCYVSLFPQLVAGPIVRYSQVAEELVSREHSLEKAARGVYFFCLGLGKKVLIADSVAGLASGLDRTGDGALATWVAAVAYAVQIYFDFSGYSDMAVGLGALFGFDFPPNFDSPYQARSMTDFWRRWHISLSTWLRDYLYIPLGGSRSGSARTYANLLATMLLGGLWHGANWTFVLWGAWHGVLLAVERALGERNPLRRLPEPLQVVATQVLVLIGWVLFRSPTIGVARAHIAAMVGLGAPASPASVGLPLAFVPVVVGLAIALLAPSLWRAPVRLGLRAGVATALVFIVSVAALLGRESSPFLYFQF
jgi:alginate O-acetyltransferase complex protein AlgI